MRNYAELVGQLVVEFKKTQAHLVRKSALPPDTAPAYTSVIIMTNLVEVGYELLAHLPLLLSYLLLSPYDLSLL